MNAMSPGKFHFSKALQTNVAMGFMAAPDRLQMKRCFLEFDAEMHHPAHYKTHHLVHYHQQLPAKNQGRGFSLAAVSLQPGETLSQADMSPSCSRADTASHPH